MIAVALKRIQQCSIQRVGWSELTRVELPWFLGLAAVVALSFWLTPSPQLYGTHRQLGLPPCPMTLLFHTRCPTCGLTTSFTAAAHGQWTTAFQAHPAGPFLWSATVLAALFFLLQLVTCTRLRAGLSPGTQTNLLFGVFIITAALGVLREVAAHF
ncbi:MAG: DUF2752 domain-containing protein [Armatimonadota bacterium]|nr:DUF2752 domain-containing protein [Armatimonadota bacterium]